VENLTPVALIGAGGIGKTSIALTVLHHDRIKHRFGGNRRFLRCDQFPATPAHLLARLSKVTGAGVENPEDLTFLRPFLSSKEMVIVLDNAESILDPQGTNAREIYGIVEELGQLETVCLCITSRISAVPPECETLDVPILSAEAAHDAFYRIYKHREQSDLVNNILEQLDFHPLSITLLATVAHHNKWTPDRLTREWESRRTDVLQTEHNKTLAATIELSLASPMFRELGPDARGLLGVVAFFPQGVDENNIDWLFPTISNRANILDKFCILSLTSRNNGCITMLAPLRDYLCPKDPKASPLLCKTKERYFTRLSVSVGPNKPGFEEARWIVSEDVNVEHLLDVFISIDAESGDIWDVCAHFMEHLSWHKRRLVALGPKIEGLRDDHPSKPECLVDLSRLFRLVGNVMEYRRLLGRALKLYRERGDDHLVAQVLRFLSDANLGLGRYKEGIWQVEEALEIYKQLGATEGQALCLKELALLLCHDGQLDDAEKAAIRAINLWSADVTVFSAKYIDSRARERRPFATWRHPWELHPLSVGTRSCFWPIAFWQNCFAMKAGSTTRKFTSSKPSRTRTRSTTYTTWVTRWRCRQTFGIGNVNSTRQSLRSCAPSAFMRSSGQRRIWRGACGSSGRLTRQQTTVSSWNRCDFLYVMTWLFQLRELDDNIDGYIDLSRRTLRPFTVMSFDINTLPTPFISCSTPRYCR